MAFAALIAPGWVAAATAGGFGLVPRLDHVLVVVMENSSYDEARAQPYTAALMTRSAVLTESYAVTHPSQPNYLTLWAGDPLGVGDDDCPPAGAPFLAANLGSACEAAGIGWRAYSEALATAGGAECSDQGGPDTGLYTRKHDPWTDFGNLDHTRERKFGDLATDIASGTLPALAFVIPNNCHNSHNGPPNCGRAQADAWLAGHLPAWIAAVGRSGAVFLTWDEDDSSGTNHILTVIAGGAVYAGARSDRRVTHVTVMRTILDLLGLPAFGAAASETPIDDVWIRPTVARGASWGTLKTHYR
jgi:acid phosphatase